MFDETIEAITHSEISVLRSLWLRAVPDEAERRSLAEAGGFPLSLVERVEAFLFPQGTP
jgi:hypothetical protein